MIYLIDHTYTNDRLALILYDDEANQFHLHQSPTPDHSSYAYAPFDTGEWLEIKEEWDERDENGNRCHPIWKDSTKVTEVQRYHPIWHREAKFLKIHFDRPTMVSANMGDGRFLENHIKYVVRYCIDKGLDFGMPYEKGWKPHQAKYSKEESILALKLQQEGFDKNMINDLLRLMLAPIPKMPIIGLDIEVHTRGNVLPNPETAPEPITAMAFAYSNAPGIILALSHTVRFPDRKRKPNVKMMKAVRDGLYTTEMFDDEREMLKRAAELLADPEYKIIATFNGDNFDMQYLHYRARQLNVYMPTRHRKYVAKNGRVYHDVHFEPKDPETRQPDMKHWKIHVDLYKFLSQPYVKDYAFRGKYSDNTLDTIALGLLGRGKIKNPTSINDLSIHDLIYYNWRDSEILIDMFNMDGGIILTLIFLMMRMGIEPMGECHRKAISSKIGNFIQKWVTKRGWITPRRKDMREFDEKNYELIRARGIKVADMAARFKGAIVIDPKPGVYFNAECRDFTGLYTNTIYRKNLSFETVNCEHDECRSNVVPEVGHHICTKRRGLFSDLVGLITTARGLHFKPLSSKKPFYEPIEQALKVFGNASYGVFGATFFAYYLRSQAESTTAYARNALESIIKKAEDLGMLVIYGDTDSIFVENFTEESMKQLVEYSANELGLELNQDYDLSFFSIGTRKKNYLGIKRDGKPVVKGFKIKKRNSPPLVAKAGDEIIKILTNVTSEKDLQRARAKIILTLRDYYTQIWKREGNIEEYAFTQQVKKRLQDYKVFGIHVRAAVMEAEAIIATLPEGVGATPEELVQPGTYQSYIKCSMEVSRSPSGKRYRIGVLPLTLAERKFIEPSHYHKELNSSMAQILDPLGLTAQDYKVIDPRRTTLDMFGVS